MAVDEKFTLPTLVVMTSACLNAADTTYYFFYIMIPNNLSKESRVQLKSLEKNFFIVK